MRLQTIRAFYQPLLACARASNPPASWLIHPHRKRWGIKSLFRKKAKGKRVGRKDSAAFIINNGAALSFRHQRLMKAALFFVLTFAFCLFTFAFVRS